MVLSNVFGIRCRMKTDQTVVGVYQILPTVQMKSQSLPSCGLWGCCDYKWLVHYEINMYYCINTGVTRY